LRVVWYGHETGSLTLREEHRLRVFGPKRDKIIGDRENCIMRILILVLFAKCNQNDTVKEDEISRACSTHGETYTYRVLVGKPEGKRPQGRPRNR
jgi:hypothetical protein